MRRTTSILLVGSILGAAGVMVLSSGSSTANFAGGGPVEATVVNTVMTEARITGQTLTLLTALDGASLESLNEPICPPMSMGHMGVDGTVRLVPPTAVGGRTKLLIVSHAATGGYLACRSGPSAGFLSPSCTTPVAGSTDEGSLLYPGASLVLDIDDSVLLRCLNCSPGGVPSGTTVQVSYLELSCL